MSSDDSRQHSSRRQHERRIKERRAVEYPFGSAEWIRRIQQENLLWPKYDRRCNDRRQHDRRQQDRRANNRSLKSRRRLAPSQPFKDHNILTDEEKQMLRELMSRDNSH
ncbi:hypothetical protein Q9L42_007975 [Methylomarinum sp. Ch1-1]|uniref:Uncharacterized protein n=1 Tax=Methylomarinum roseum TaxID=3067653 RepID=A0AAU7NYN9_9GAMM|nr:hypothetical protein [Methylomarinum sp. Ch1-1]MDP4521842.1 hypothetical protein [Methylomarinum sp. Ch1-1]